MRYNIPMRMTLVALVLTLSSCAPPRRACGELQTTPAEITLAAQSSAFSASDMTACTDPPWFPTADTALPNLLIIGDSISYGYTDYLAPLLAGRYDVFHNNCNGRTSRNGVLKVDQWLSEASHWDVILFNHGLWDLHEDLGMTAGDYRRNISTLASKLREHAPRVYFVATTLVPSGDGDRTQGQEIVFNKIAQEETSGCGIGYIDLHAFSRTQSHLMLDPVGMQDVHFTAQGYENLAGFILGHL